MKQFTYTDIAGGRQHAEPHIDHNPVLIAKRHHIGNGADGDKIDIATAHILDGKKIIFAAVDKLQFKGTQYFENHTDTG